MQDAEERGKKEEIEGETGGEREESVFRASEVHRWKTLGSYPFKIFREASPIALIIRVTCQDHGKYKDIYIYIHIQKDICTHTCTYTCRCQCLLISQHEKTQSRTCTFHDVYCSKPLAFHNVFMCFCFSLLFQTLLQISSPCSSDRQMGKSKARTGRQQRMCSAWHLRTGRNGRQPDNTCEPVLIDPSEEKGL